MVVRYHTKRHVFSVSEEQCIAVAADDIPEEGHPLISRRLLGVVLESDVFARGMLSVDALGTESEDRYRLVFGSTTGTSAILTDVVLLVERSSMPSVPPHASSTLMRPPPRPSLLPPSGSPG